MMLFCKIRSWKVRITRYSLVHAIWFGIALSAFLTMHSVTAADQVNNFAHPIVSADKGYETIIKNIDEFFELTRQGIVRSREFYKTLPQPWSNIIVGLLFIGEIARKLRSGGTFFRLAIQGDIKWLNSLLEILPRGSKQFHIHTRKLEQLVSRHAKMGKHDQVERVLERIFKKRLEVLGLQHSKTIIAATDLGKFYGDKLEYDKAISLLERALFGSKYRYGLNHPVSISLMKYLANLCSSKGDDEKSQEWTQRACRHQKKS